jgi:hypothetical protein
VCVITLIRGSTLWGRLWICSVLFNWLTVFSSDGGPPEATQRPRIPDVGFRGLEVT